MEEEESSYYNRKFRVDSFWDKLKRKIKLFQMSPSEINEMKNILIEEARPLYFDYIDSKHPDEPFNNLVKEHYNERIETLPRGVLYTHYNLFIEYKNAKGKKYEGEALHHFFTNTDLHFNLDRWLREKMVNLIIEEG